MIAPRTPLSLNDDVDAWVDHFESEWQAGRPLIEQYLTDYAGTDSSRLLRELVCLDIVYRRKNGETAEVSEYTKRIPTFGLLPANEREWVERAVQRSVHGIPSQIGKYRVLARLAEGDRQLPIGHSTLICPDQWC